MKISMFVNSNIISCNSAAFPSLNLHDPKLKTSLQSQQLRPRISFRKTGSNFSAFCQPHNHISSILASQKKGLTQICHCTLTSQNSEDAVVESLLQSQQLRPRISFRKTGSNFSAFCQPHNHISSILASQKKGLTQICHCTLTSQNSEDAVVEKRDSSEGGLGGGGNDGEERDWTTSILLLVLWGALMYYVFNLTPNQTPSRDVYFLKKLLNLKGDDGFTMNEVLVSLWYIMGLWPLVYSMLLLPTGRSSKSNIPVWPFIISSFFGGAYALLPYFVLWRPPPPPVEETEIRRWPLNFLESKLTAAISLAAGLGILVYAGLANWETWKEFYQYFRESKFIHITCLDFTLLSAFAPFWVYNDMTARKWFDKGSWLLPLSLVPFLGPALYIVLRPSLSSMSISLGPTTSEPK